MGCIEKENEPVSSIELGMEVLKILGIEKENVSEFSIFFKPTEAVKVYVSFYLSEKEGEMLKKKLQEYKIQNK